MAADIHVIGAGGIGVAMAWSLSRAGRRVVLVEKHAEKLAAGMQDGVSVDGQPALRLPFMDFNSWNPPQDAIILLCSKTYDNPSILERIGDYRQLVPVQNGYDPLLDSHEHAGEAIASFVSECERDSPRTRITRAGELHIGTRRHSTAEDRAMLAELAADCQRGGLDVVLVDDVLPYKAAKLMYNAAISPLAAAAGVDNATLLSDRIAKRLFFGLLRENHAILRNAGLPLAKIGPFHPDTVVRILRTPGLPELMAVFFRPSLRGTYCSMAPDIGRGETEIDAYNGHLLRLAGETPCTLNRAAVRMVKRITEEQLLPGRAHLDDMVAELQTAGARA